MNNDREEESATTESIEASSRESSSRETRTIRMTIAYDGTNYCGWQIQPNGTSIQFLVERALSDFLNEPTKVVASGRTDAGVHAIGQVISFVTRSTVPCRGLLHGLASYLPEDIVVRDVQEASPGFNARFDATSKWYRYVIHNSPIRLPFLRNAVLWQRSRLDEVAMNAAVQHLIGTHDFRCFETQWPNRSSSVRTISHARVFRTQTWDAWSTGGVEVPPLPAFHSRDTERPQSANDQPFICFDVQADGFLYNMVRSIVGTLIHVGRGRWTPDDFLRILQQGQRIHAGETAPPQGLYLMRVDYETAR